MGLSFNAKLCRHIPSECLRFKMVFHYVACSVSRYWCGGELVHSCYVLNEWVVMSNRGCLKEAIFGPWAQRYGWDNEPRHCWKLEQSELSSAALRENCGFHIKPRSCSCHYRRDYRIFWRKITRLSSKKNLWANSAQCRYSLLPMNLKSLGFLTCTEQRIEAWRLWVAPNKLGVLVLNALTGIFQTLCEVSKPLRIIYSKSVIQRTYWTVKVMFLIQPRLIEDMCLWWCGGSEFKCLGSVVKRLHQTQPYCFLIMQKYIHWCNRVI